LSAANRLSAVASPARTQGGAIHDARIAALCLYHGVTELWSADRDFTRFPTLAVRNPLMA
jgi:predicted nucleic acid-binding protein